MYPRSATAQGTRHRLSRTARRAVIEDAAARLFAEQGYAATTFVQIAATAGVTKQLLYQHVSSKRELHLSLLARHRDALIGQIAPAMNTPGTAAERIHHTLDAWFSYLEDQPHAARLLFRDVTGDPEIEAFHEQMRNAARAANRSLLHNDTTFAIQPDEAELVAEIVRAATVGLALWWADHPEVPRNRIVDIGARTLTHGLLTYARPARRKDTTHHSQPSQ